MLGVRAFPPGPRHRVAPREYPGSGRGAIPVMFRVVPRPVGDTPATRASTDSGMKQKMKAHNNKNINKNKNKNRTQKEVDGESPVRERSPLRSRGDETNSGKSQNSLNSEGSNTLRELLDREGCHKEPRVALERISSTDSMVSIITERRKTDTEKERDSEDTEEMSDNVDVILGIEKKGPDRPPTTGGYYVLLEKQAKERELADLQREADILNPAIKPRDTKSYKRFVERIEEKQGEYEQAPLQDLEALVSERTAAIYKIAVDSGNMKGTLTKQAKEAAADICAAATVLAIKAQNPIDVPQHRQVEELRKQLRERTMENVHLKKALVRFQKKSKGESKLISQIYTSEEENTQEQEQNKKRSTRIRKEGKTEEEASLPPKDGEASTLLGKERMHTETREPHFHT